MGASPGLEHRGAQGPPCGVALRLKAPKGPLLRVRVVPAGASPPPQGAPPSRGVNRNAVAVGPAPASGLLLRNVGTSDTRSGTHCPVRGVGIGLGPSVTSLPPENAAKTPPPCAPQGGCSSKNWPGKRGAVTGPVLTPPLQCHPLAPPCLRPQQGEGMGPRPALLLSMLRDLQQGRGQPGLNGPRGLTTQRKSTPTPHTAWSCPVTLTGTEPRGSPGRRGPHSASAAPREGWR